MGHTECKLDWWDWQGGAHVTGEVAGRLVPECCRSSLSCPLSSEAGIGAPVVQPQGSHWVVPAEVLWTAPGLSFWGAKRRWVTGGREPRGPGSCMGRPCGWLVEPIGPTVGSTAPLGALEPGKGLPGVEKGDGEARRGSGLASGPEDFLVQDSQHSRW